MSDEKLKLLKKIYNENIYYSEETSLYAKFLEFIKQDLKEFNLNSEIIIKTGLLLDITTGEIVYFYKKEPFNTRERLITIMKSIFSYAKIIISAVFPDNKKIIYIYEDNLLDGKKNGWKRFKTSNFETFQFFNNFISKDSLNENNFYSSISGEMIKITTYINYVYKSLNLNNCDYVYIDFADSGVYFYDRVMKEIIKKDELENIFIKKDVLSDKKTTIIITPIYKT